MRVAIVGYGKMGREIEKVCSQRGIEVVSTVDPLAKDAKHRAIDCESMRAVEVVIDFTTPDAAISNIKKYAELGINAVIGTTGWYKELSSAKSIVDKSGIGLIWSGNFSIGVNLLFRIIRDACKTMKKVKDYDAYVYELHHSQKKDSPSGTAEMIGKIIISEFPKKKRIVTERLDRKISEDELHVASVRGGSIPGTHVVGFDSAFDTIEIKHEARTREGFALGAVMAAEWIYKKKGFFGMDDFMGD